MRESEHKFTSRLNGRRLAPVCLLLAVGLLSSAWCLRGGYHWDDHGVILGHPAVMELRKTPLLFLPTYWDRAHAEVPSPYRPVREITFALMAALGRGKPLPFHAVSLALHLANILLVYAVAQVVMGRREVALLAALLFAAHPVHAEVVCWAKNVGELLALGFVLISWLAFERAGSGGPWPRGRWWLVLAVLAYALGLLSKESAGALPLILVAAAFLWKSGCDLKRALCATIPFWVVSALYAVLQWKVLSMGGQRFLEGEGLSTPARITLAAKTLFHYLGILIFPVRMNPWRELALPGPTTTWFPAFWGTALFVGLAAFFVRKGRPGSCANSLTDSRSVGFAWLWTCIALAPAANIIAANAIRPIAEQRLYLPSVGVCLWLAAVLWTLTSKPGAAESWTARRTVPAAAMVCVLTALSVMACGPWSSRLALWRYVVRLRPRHAQAHNNLAVVYEKAAGEALVIRQYEHVAQIDPRHVEARYNLGAFYQRRGNLEEAERELRRALEIDPKYAPAHKSLGRLWERRGRPEAALAAYKRAIYLKPHYADAHYNAGTVYEQLGKPREAAKAYARAIELNPGHAHAHTNLGCLIFRGSDPSKLEKARGAFARALHADPQCWQAHAGLATVYASAGRADQAIASYRAALALVRDGSHEAAVLRLGLADTLLNAGQPAAARREVKAALRADPGNKAALRLLAKIDKNPPS